MISTVTYQSDVSYDRRRFALHPRASPHFFLKLVLNETSITSVMHTLDRRSV